MRSEPSPDLVAAVDRLIGVARTARDDFVAWRRTSLGLKGMLIYVLAVPLPLAGVVALARGQLGQALGAVAAFVLVALAGYLNRRGILEELVEGDRRFTRSLRLPHKYLAAGSLVAGTMVGAQAAAGHSLGVGLLFGLLALLGFHLSYRLPPPAGALGLKREVVPDKGLRRALEQAERRILAIEKAALSIGNAELGERLGRIAVKGRSVLGVIAERPAERFRARKFLNVYLEGAERVASRYVKTHRLARGRELEQNFRTVLVDIEQVFDRQLLRLSEEDVFDLDVQIEVLRKQLDREGIT